MANIYTSDDVTCRNNSKGLWIVIHGNVYDLTKFYKEHPGGEEVLLELAGKDGSKCFDSIGHSDEAIMLRDSFKIGELMKNEILEMPDATVKSELKKSTVMPESDETKNWQSEEHDKQEERSFLPLITAAVALYACIIYYIWFW